MDSSIATSKPNANQSISSKEVTGVHRFGVNAQEAATSINSGNLVDYDTFQAPIFEIPRADPKNVASIILGGGAGTRLFPLTSRRAKPAVPIGGCYRLIDIPMSNCINSGIKKIFILTQFNSFSLNRPSPCSHV